MSINKEKLTDHIDACIEIAESKQEQKVADVLRNLNDEVKAGEFDEE
ncbi:hypothetical protein QYF50_15445 [Paenibacillus vini]|nr:hypothetical protein [Paenibacillus vini]MDN4069246.1 hypothetical protein [Paenibacillus vini]MDN4069299.1 hypothetical protein [Paenibacillus vini]